MSDSDSRYFIGLAPDDHGDVGGLRPLPDCDQQEPRDPDEIMIARGVELKAALARYADGESRADAICNDVLFLYSVAPCAPPAPSYALKASDFGFSADDCAIIGARTYDYDPDLSERYRAAVARARAATWDTRGFPVREEGCLREITGAGPDAPRVDELTVYLPHDTSKCGNNTTFRVNLHCATTRDEFNRAVLQGRASVHISADIIARKVADHWRVALVARFINARTNRRV